ncbi:DUF3885 domain-containing protein [Knoellia koreensis]|uniref:DUF3885 domain-containing protein n=1 Tax=Knoellia koreensis TaxID=2730921 RepID=A0A849HM11_9MICO|nr:hypothetical protein [Knoellia sp. DB2414S]NNM45647.1 hypothetical protein [Knoellia sp. DB2414S]
MAEREVRTLLADATRDIGFGVRNSLRWRILRLRGLAGDSQRPERSERAAQMTKDWDRVWGGVPPRAWHVGRGQSDRWVRFHSLPGGKRYADTSAEYAEILARHRTLLAALQGETGSRNLLVIAVDFAHRDLASGRSRRALPTAWPWRRFEEPDDPDAPVYCWVKEGLTSEELDAVLISAADDVGQFVICAESLAWLYIPYDGGVDVVASSREGRLELESRFRAWLPGDS